MCCPTPESICLPGYRCDKNVWTRVCETDKTGIESCSLCNKTNYDLGLVLDLDKDCTREAKYDCSTLKQKHFNTFKFYSCFIIHWQILIYGKESAKVRKFATNLTQFLVQK